MLLKDYYNVLQIPPHATLQEIKQAYRRLAMIYHPDKTKNDTYANAQFGEIKEAYEVLTHPVKKENWLQERWYNQMIGKKKTAAAITPVSILRLCLELEKYVSQLDVYRMNKPGLATHIQDLLSAETIDKLRQFNETAINRQIITTLLACMRVLPLKSIKQLSGLLETLAGTDEVALERIRNFLSDQNKIFLWEKYKIVVIIILTLMICLLIYINTK